jgi:hypothetical protein
MFAITAGTPLSKESNTSAPTLVFRFSKTQLTLSIWKGFGFNIVNLYSSIQLVQLKLMFQMLPSILCQTFCQLSLPCNLK